MPLQTALFKSAETCEEFHCICKWHNFEVLILMMMMMMMMITMEQSSS
jgi:hypothetical protein